jgi:LAO/AO transport system kinase
MREEDLTAKLLKGDRRAAAKLITTIENNPRDAKKVMREVYRHTGRAQIVGITGPPGSGKSTLIDRLTSEFRKRGKTVGVIAVDVSSPFSGGAFLGDRIRMKNLSTDSGVFIRSMATRGCMGGLARATCDAIKILDAFGKDVILVETVGTGQDEVDIINAAHTSIVVTVPGLGDEIQAIKAGTMEIADIFVVNKADREGADMAVSELRAMLDLADKRGWKPPVVMTAAIEGAGIAGLVDRINEHYKYLKDNDLLKPWLKRRAEMEIVNIAKDIVARDVAEMKKSDAYKKLLEEIVEKKIDPHSAADKIMKMVKSKATK